VHDLELAAIERELIQRSRRLGVSARRDHVRDVLERAAASHNELRFELGHGVGHRSEHIGDVRAHATAVALRERIAVDELRGERADPEVLARRVLQPAGVADHDLDAAAAEVEAQRRRGLEEHAGADGAEDQLGFTRPADHLDADAGLGLDLVHHLAAVGRAPQRARAAGHDLVGPGGVGELTEPADHGHRGIGGVVGDAPVAGDQVAEPEHLLLRDDGLESALGPDLRHDQVERVRSQVECGHAHAAQATHGV
jgi:hypothetical protein